MDKLESRRRHLWALLSQHVDMDIDQDFHQLKAIIDRLENMSDRCKPNAELLRHMGVEYIEEE